MQKRQAPKDSESRAVRTLTQTSILSPIMCIYDNQPTNQPPLLTRLGSNKTLLDFVPVDNVPDGVNILGTKVTIINVICVLPNIDTKQGNKTSRGLQRILIRTGAAFDAALKMNSNRARVRNTQQKDTRQPKALL